MSAEDAFARFDREACRLELSENSTDVSKMILQGVTENDEVVQVGIGKRVTWLQKTVLQSLESRWCAFQSKWHGLVLKEAKRGREGCLRTGRRGDQYLPVAMGEVQEVK